MSKEEKIILYGLAVLTAITIVASAAWGWYRAGEQAKQYERQGIHLSQWDVFIGVKPAEQVVQIKEHK